MMSPMVSVQRGQRPPPLNTPLFTDYQGRYPCIEYVPGRYPHHIRRENAGCIIKLTSPQLDRTHKSKQFHWHQQVRGLELYLRRNHQPIQECLLCPIWQLWGASWCPGCTGMRKWCLQWSQCRESQLRMYEAKSLSAHSFPKGAKWTKHFEIATALHPPMYTHYRNDKHSMKADYMEMFVELTDRNMERNRDSPNLEKMLHSSTDGGVPPENERRARPTWAPALRSTSISRGGSPIGTTISTSTTPGG